MASEILTNAVTVWDFETKFDELFGAVSPLEVGRSLRRALTIDRDRPAVSMAVERTYVDKDFTASYYMQAGRAFMPTDKNAQRVHFFSAAPNLLETVSIPSSRPPTRR